MLSDLAIFDVFCWWYDQNRRQKEVDSLEEDEEDDSSVDRLQAKEISYRDFLPSLKLDTISNFEPHKLGNPDTITVKEIVNSCASGKWMLPKFQRYFD